MERLVAWLWQGTMLAVLMWGVLRVWRPNAATRYALWWTTLLAIFVLLVVNVQPRGGITQITPASMSAPVSTPASTPVSTSVVEAIEAAASPSSLLPFTLPAVPRAVMAVVIGAWLGLSLLGLVHLALCVSQLHRMKRASWPFPVDRERRLARWMSMRGQGRPARLCLSEDVRSASALGLGAGVAIIALNPSLLDDVDDEELDLIVLHEYAHIQRRDDWWHVLQVALRTVLCVHPAAMGIGRVLRLEREAACDDWVVERTQMVTMYARCLMTVATFELSRPDDALAAVGAMGRRGDLTRRIERLLAPPAAERTPTRMSAVPVAGMAMVMSVAIIVMGQLPPLVAMSSDDATDAAATVAVAASTMAPSMPMPISTSTSTVDVMAIASAVNIARERVATTLCPTPNAAPLAIVPASYVRARVEETTPPIESRSLATVAHLMSTLPMATATSTPTSAPGADAATIASLGVTTHHAAFEEDADFTSGAGDVTRVAAVSVRRAWWNTAAVGSAIGDGAANAGVSVGEGAKRAGVATGRAGVGTGKFFSRVATNIAKAAIH